MTNQPDCEQSSKTINPNNSSPLNPSSLSVSPSITPQILLDKQEDQHVSSGSNPHLTLLLDHSSTTRPRKGFNSTDFQTDSHSTHLSSTHNTLSSSPTSFQYHQPPSVISIRQRIYQIIDSVPLTLVVFLLMATDFCFFLTAYLYILQHQHSPLFRHFYIVVDWITAVIYLLEVNIRLYAYGPHFYFHGALRCLDYVIATTNAIFVVTYSIYHDQWVLVTRFIRTLRMVTAITSWRERKLKGRTRQQLESLAELLEKEKSDRSKLTKWKIDPEAIAIGERAGRGGFGTVFSGLFRGTLVAIKQVSYADHEQALISIEDEAITLVNLRHPNVVLFMGFVHEPSQLWIVTEYCSRGSLRDLLDDPNLKLTEGRILKLALGAARGLAYLHGQDPPVLHLDLKTSNVLISSGWDAKLGDFGLSRSIDKIEKDWFSGTMQYAAPEILEANMFSTAADIYSFGICLWEMAAREVPFQGFSPMAVLWGVVKSQMRPPIEIIKVAPKQAGETKSNDSLPKEIQPCPNSVSDGISLNDLPILQETSTTHQERKNIPSSSALTTYRVEREQHPHPNGALGQQPHNSLELLDHEKIIERVEENDKTGIFTKDPVTASIVEGIVLPLSLNTRDKKSFQEIQNGQENQESGSLSQPKKKISAFREQNRVVRTEHDSHLSGITSKVTETIHMFDERPPVIRRKEEKGSNDYGVHSRTESVEGSVSGGQSLRTRRNLVEKTSLRLPRQFSKLKSNNKPGQSGSRKEMGPKWDEDDPFVRRLASVSQQTNRSEISGGTSESQQATGGESWRDDMKSSDGQNGEVGDCVLASRAVLPREYVELMQRCWSHDPKDRPSAGEIVWRLVILIDSQMREK